MKTCTKCGVEKEDTEFYGKKSWCKVCERARVKAWAIKNPEKKKRTDAEYYVKNRKVCKDRVSARYQEKKDEIKSYTRGYSRARYASDPLYRITRQLRHAFQQAFKNKGFSKPSRTLDLVGLPYDLLINHLEYTWFLNYGTEYAGERVQIDHVVPLASSKTLDEVVLLQHWTNLQYLTPEDNRAKWAHQPSPAS